MRRALVLLALFLPACTYSERVTLDPLPALIEPSQNVRLTPAEPVAIPADLQQPPADFTLAVSVISPQGFRSAHVPTDERAARYIIESDRQLRAWVGRDLPRSSWPLRGGPDRTFPGLTRTLTDAQIARLNWLVDNAGLPEAPATEGDAPANLAVPRDRLVYVISVMQNQHRRWALLDAAGAAPAARALVSELATLAYQEAAR